MPRHGPSAANSSDAGYGAFVIILQSYSVQSTALVDP